MAHILSSRERDYIFSVSSQKGRRREQPRAKEISYAARLIVESFRERPPFEEMGSAHLKKREKGISLIA